MCFTFSNGKKKSLDRPIKSGLMSVVLFFMVSAVTLCRWATAAVGLAGKVHPSRVWHLVPSGHGHKKTPKHSAAPVMLHRRSREGHRGSHRWIGFLKSGLMIYWCYPVTGFLNSRHAIAVCHLDSLQEVRGGFVSGFKKSVIHSVCCR